MSKRRLLGGTPFFKVPYFRGVPPFSKFWRYYPGVVSYTFDAGFRGGYPPTQKPHTFEFRGTCRNGTALPPLDLEAVAATNRSILNLLKSVSQNNV